MNPNGLSIDQAQAEMREALQRTVQGVVPAAQAMAALTASKPAPGHHAFWDPDGNRKQRRDRLTDADRPQNERRRRR